MHPKVSVLTLVCMNVFLSRKPGVRLRHAAAWRYNLPLIMQYYQLGPPWYYGLSCYKQ